MSEIRCEKCERNVYIPEPEERTKTDIDEHLTFHNIHFCRPDYEAKCEELEVKLKASESKVAELQKRATIKYVDELSAEKYELEEENNTLFLRVDDCLEATEKAYKFAYDNDDGNYKRMLSRILNIVRGKR